MYVQAVISPTLQILERGEKRDAMIAIHTGGIDRAFCEKISTLLDSGEWQLQEDNGPIISHVDGEWRLKQEVRWCKPN